MSKITHEQYLYNLETWLPTKIYGNYKSVKEMHLYAKQQQKKDEILDIILSNIILPEWIQLKIKTIEEELNT